MALVDRLAERSGADSESFFEAHGLGTAYQRATRGSKKAKITSALRAAERRGNIDEVLDSASQYLAGASVTSIAKRKFDVVAEKSHVGTGQRIFISHASTDKSLADLLRNTLILGGVSEETIFYSSARATGIPVGQDVRTHLREVLRGSSLVVELISSTFLRRPLCMMELGGAWTLGKSTSPIVIPPLGREKAMKQLGEVHMGILGGAFDVDEIFDELNIRLLQDVGCKVKVASWNRAVREFKEQLPAKLPSDSSTSSRRASSTARRRSSTG